MENKWIQVNVVGRGIDEIDGRNVNPASIRIADIMVIKKTGDNSCRIEFVHSGHGMAYDVAEPYETIVNRVCGKEDK